MCHKPGVSSSTINLGQRVSGRCPADATSGNSQFERHVAAVVADAPMLYPRPPQFLGRRSAPFRITSLEQHRKKHSVYVG